MTADAPDSYPDVQTKSVFLSAGNYNLVHLEMTKTFTTDQALATGPDKRNCYQRHEKPLRNFDSYTQSNCWTNYIIEGFKEQCGCVGRYRGGLVK